MDPASTDRILAAREAELRRANAAGKRREQRDPSLRDTNEIRGRAVLGLVAGGMERDKALVLADQITRRRVGDDAWERFQTHRLHEARHAATLKANGVELAPTLANRSKPATDQTG